MQNLFKNKLFIIFSLFIILVAFISSSCFASFDFTYNDTSYSVDDFNNLLSEKNDNNTDFVLLFITQGSPSAYSSDYILFTYSGNLYYKLGYLYVLDNDFSALKCGNFYYHINKYNVFNWERYGEGWDTYHNSDCQWSIVYSTSDVYSYDDKSTVVFQVAPQAQGEAVQVELMKPTQVQEIPQQIVAVVMIVLPIFLGIFGVLLVLYLIKSKNLLQL